MNADSRLALLRQFAQDVRAKSTAPSARGGPEDQLKTPLDNLISSLSISLGFRRITVVGQPTVDDAGRPDFSVFVEELLTGAIETKAPGKGANPSKYSGHDKDQWARFKDIPNIIYTDGNEWTLFQSGAQASSAHTSGDIVSDGPSCISLAFCDDLTRLLELFLAWEPIAPKSPQSLAETLAPLARLLRRAVEDSLKNADSNLSHLAEDWRSILFPDADDSQFADAYAQTLTYALLLAHVDGLKMVETDSAAKALRKGHAVLAQALTLLADDQVRSEIGPSLKLLERSITAVDMSKMNNLGEEPWLYFYEHFLREYDRKLQKERGVYYTPVQVVHAQTAMAEDLLINKFKKVIAFADDDVIYLDPCVGTGTYPLFAITQALKRVEQRYGKGKVPEHATDIANRIYGFEILVGPYSVSHLRITRSIKDAGGHLPQEGAHIYLTDTLDSPFAALPGRPPLPFKPLADEHGRARKVKAETRVLVCMGNPPYNRQVIESAEEAKVKRKGGWIRFKDETGSGAILSDFIEPAKALDAGKHLKNLYNDYVYFWRWALWKVFEAHNTPGIVSFISASSYLRGPGFVGMRKMMRELFDDLWIIDLEGDNRGARKTENVFPTIQTPVAIAVGARYASSRPHRPARVHYSKIVGTEGEKLDALANIEKIASLKWKDCYSDWLAPFLPVGYGDYFSWPLLTNLFPWQHSGVQMKRTWPIAPDKQTLDARWNALMESPNHAALFHETRDRKVNRKYPRLLDAASDGPVQSAQKGDISPTVAPYFYRFLDRQYIFADNRLGDFMKPSLWLTLNERQIYMTAFLTGILGEGPACTCAPTPPDLDFFRGSFGAKHIIPLWRDSAASLPNLPNGLIRALSSSLHLSISPEDFFAYCYAVLSNPAYTVQFSDELVEPGPHVPITKDKALFQSAANLGERLIWLHTFAQRFHNKLRPKGEIPAGSAMCTKPIPSNPEDYPNGFSYDFQRKQLKVGKGVIEPVAPEVWNYSVSGFKPLSSWLNYRMREPVGKKHSSELDKIRPTKWKKEFTTQLLELIWVLEATIALHPQLRSLLESIVAGDTFQADELPKPSPEERKPPKLPEESRVRTKKQKETIFPSE